MDHDRLCLMCLGCEVTATSNNTLRIFARLDWHNATVLTSGTPLIINNANCYSYCDYHKSIFVASVLPARKNKRPNVYKCDELLCGRR